MARLLTKQIKKLIGTTLKEKVSLPVDRRELHKYCYAVGDLNPLYTDEKYAKKGRYGELIASPAYGHVAVRHQFPSIFKPTPAGTQTFHELKELSEKLGLPRVLDVGQYFEFYQPVRVGDTLTVESKIVDIMEKQIKAGPALLLTQEERVINQKGELVCIEQIKLMFY